MKKIECYKPKKTMCAKVYKNSVAESLTEKTVLSAYFCHYHIIYYRAKENHIERVKSEKKASSMLITHILETISVQYKCDTSVPCLYCLF